MWHVLGRGEVILFRWGVLSERNHLEDLGLNGKIILKLIFRKWDWNAVTKDRHR
jgi:hypothetical protein